VRFARGEDGALSRSDADLSSSLRYQRQRSTPTGTVRFDQRFAVFTCCSAFVGMAAYTRPAYTLRGIAGRARSEDVHCRANNWPRGVPSSGYWR